VPVGKRKTFFSTARDRQSYFTLGQGKRNAAAKIVFAGKAVRFKHNAATHFSLLKSCRPIPIKAEIS
jgi:hypothetical protein